MKQIVLNPRERFRRVAHCFAVLTTLSCPAFAQTAPAPTPTRPANDETITLSPFVVAEGESGWSANSTLSATRTRQELKDLPVNIDAITADFMEDLGLFTADEVTKFVANVYAAPPMENDSGSDNFSFRGLVQQFNVSRNYFRWYVMPPQWDLTATVKF